MDVRVSIGENMLAGFDKAIGTRSTTCKALLESSCAKKQTCGNLGPKAAAFPPGAHMSHAVNRLAVLLATLTFRQHLLQTQTNSSFVMQDMKIKRTSFPTFQKLRSNIEFALIPPSQAPPLLRSTRPYRRSCPVHGLLKNSSSFAKSSRWDPGRPD